VKRILLAYFARVYTVWLNRYHAWTVGDDKLDAWGRMVDVYRTDWETPDEFRARIAERLTARPMREIDETDDEFRERLRMRFAEEWGKPW
jgi:hypothetical protein